MIEILLIVIALALVVACGAFVAAEFAFVTVDRSSVDRAAEAGDKSARGVQTALRHLSTQLSSAQVGITLTNLLIGFLAEPAIADLVRGPLTSAGVPEGAVSGVALAIALVLATGVTMIFGELVPKNLAIAKPLATARAVQGFLRGFTRVAGVIVRFFNGTANAVLRRIGIEPQEELASARSPEELSSLVRRSAEQGTLEGGTAALLERSLAFGERRAHEIMTPRGRVATVAEDDPVAVVIEQARASGRSRFPVVGAQRRLHRHRAHQEGGRRALRGARRHAGRRRDGSAGAGPVQPRARRPARHAARGRAADGARRRRVRQRRRPRHARGSGRGDRRRGPRRARRRPRSRRGASRTAAGRCPA